MKRLVTTPIACNLRRKWGREEALRGMRLPSWPIISSKTWSTAISLSLHQHRRAHKFKKKNVQINHNRRRLALSAKTLKNVTKHFLIPNRNKNDGRVAPTIFVIKISRKTVAATKNGQSLLIDVQFGSSSNWKSQSLIIWMMRFVSRSLSTEFVARYLLNESYYRIGIENKARRYRICVTKGEISDWSEEKSKDFRATPNHRQTPNGQLDRYRYRSSAIVCRFHLTLYVNSGLVSFLSIFWSNNWICEARNQWISMNESGSHTHAPKQTVASDAGTASDVSRRSLIVHSFRCDKKKHRIND